MNRNLLVVRAAAGGLAVVVTSAGAMGAVDGVVNAGDMYGAALAVQTTQTGFTDNLSELNAAFGVISGGRLQLAITGNITNIFNNIEVFLDSRPGGQNVYASAGNDNTAAMNGFVFDSGFTADYHLNFRRGVDGTPRFNVDFADLQGGAASGYTSLFGAAMVGSGATGTGVNANPIEVAYNDSNAAGVTGGSGAANQAAAAAVTTGLEFSVALSDIVAAGEVRVLVFINNQGHNFASNQFLPGLVTPQGNLGGDGAGGFTGSLNGLNLNNFYPGANEGWFTVAPAPGAAGLLGLGALAALRRRR